MTDETRLPKWLDLLFKDYRASMGLVAPTLLFQKAGSLSLGPRADRYDIMAELIKEITDSTESNQDLAQKYMTQIAVEDMDYFPFVRRLLIGHMWASLNHSVRELVSIWLRMSHGFDEKLFERKPLSDVQIPLIILSDTYMNVYWSQIADRIGEHLKYKRFVGCDRFEVLLRAVGIRTIDCQPFLTTERGKLVWQQIAELHQVRNCIVHNHGCVDARLMENCPWMKVQFNEQLLFTPRSLIKYAAAADAYFHDIASRAAMRFDCQVPPLPREFWVALGC